MKNRLNRITGAGVSLAPGVSYPSRLVGSMFLFVFVYAQTLFPHTCSLSSTTHKANLMHLGSPSPANSLSCLLGSEKGNQLRVKRARAAVPDGLHRAEQYGFPLGHW